ncbi:hypothetical protein GCM10027075_41790 [Streptomyces heilongjiangensis]
MQFAVSRPGNQVVAVAILGQFAAEVAVAAEESFVVRAGEDRREPPEPAPGAAVTLLDLRTVSDETVGAVLGPRGQEPRVVVLQAPGAGTAPAVKFRAQGTVAGSERGQQQAGCFLAGETGGVAESVKVGFA